MRGCLFTLALGALVVAALVGFALPRATEGLVAAALTGAGFTAAATSVSVATDPPTELIGLHADRVAIVARDARFGDLAAARVDVVLTDVDLGARSAASITGTLDDAATDSADGRLRIPRITLTGDTRSIVAVASIDGPDVEALVAERVTTALGERPTDVALEAPDVLTVTIRGLPVRGTLRIDDAGGIRLALAAPIEVAITLLEPGTLPLRLRAVRVTGDRLIAEGDVDLGALLAGTVGRGRSAEPAG